ncbi:MAG: hypothetical protein QOG28_3717, partial [Trebonia sp.]|nr:hypothetical protein [Trebonia sp.]
MVMTLSSRAVAAVSAVAVAAIAVAAIAVDVQALAAQAGAGAVGRPAGSTVVQDATDATGTAPRAAAVRYWTPA